MTYDLIGTLEGEDDLGILTLMMRADRYRWLTALGALLDAALVGHDAPPTPEILAVRDALRAGDLLNAPWKDLAQAAVKSDRDRSRVAYFFGMAAFMARCAKAEKARDWMKRALRDGVDDINVRTVALPAWQAYREAE